MENGKILRDPDFTNKSSLVLSCATVASAQCKIYSFYLVFTCKLCNLWVCCVFAQPVLYSVLYFHCLIVLPPVRYYVQSRKRPAMYLVRTNVLLLPTTFCRLFWSPVGNPKTKLTSFGQ